MQERDNRMDQLFRYPTSTEDSGEPLEYCSQYCNALKTRFTISEHKNLVKLKNLQDVLDPQERMALLVEKIDNCNAMHDFSNQNSEIASKKVKRSELDDILDYLMRQDSVVPTCLYGLLINMIKKNLFPTSSPQETQHCDIVDFEDSVEEEPAWYHLGTIYLIFFTFITRPDNDMDIVTKLLDVDFILQMFELMSTNFPPEREALLYLILLLYNSTVELKSHVLKALKNFTYQVIYENRERKGICKLVELISCIVTGSNTSLTQETYNFIKKVIMPLHKPPSYLRYHQTLWACIVRVVQKYPLIVDEIILDLIKYWPKTDSIKEIMFIVEIEKIIEVATDLRQDTLSILFRKISLCISSLNSRVSHRALLLWENTRVSEVIHKNANSILPELFNALYYSPNVIDDPECVPPPCICCVS